MDGAERGKFGPAEIEGVLLNFKSDVLVFFFSKPIRIKDFNEAEVPF